MVLRDGAGILGRPIHLIQLRLPAPAIRFRRLWMVPVWGVAQVKGREESGSRCAISALHAMRPKQLELELLSCQRR